ncbi:MAG: L,D-transpeptidase family protein [Verrucomicrobiales bacterium]
MKALQLTALLILTVCPSARAFELPRVSRQCIVGVSEHWNSSKVTLTCYEKRGETWIKKHGPWPGRLGKNGSIWGRGLHPLKAGDAVKKEGDGRAPAGVFAIGGAWGYTSSIRKHPKLPYRQITPRDLWVEDADSPHYNHHLILDHLPATNWEKRQQMRQDDHAHSLKLFIAHNAPPHVIPGAGSAIFFHIWRDGGARPTAGCTTLSEDRLRTMIAWIDPGEQPLYVLLPSTIYQSKRSQWKLP